MGAKQARVELAAFLILGMVVAAAERGWVEREKSVMEILTSIKRAGADMILTYFAKEAVGYMR